MIRGRFGNTTGRPYLEARVYLPRLTLMAEVSFLIDTGADKTVVMPIDGLRLFVNYDMLDNPALAFGVGGQTLEYREQAIVVFNDPGRRLYMYTFDIFIAAPTPANGAIPSLLGRDLLANWTMLYDRPHDRLWARVVQADDIIDIASP